MLLKGVIIAGVIFGHVAGNVHQLQATALAALQIIKAVAEAEHDLTRGVNFVAGLIAANLTNIHPRGGFLQKLTKETMKFLKHCVTVQLLALDRKEKIRANS